MLPIASVLKKTLGTLMLIVESSPRRRPAANGWRELVAWLVGAVLILGCVAAFCFWPSTAPSLAVRSIPNQRAIVGQELTVQLTPQWSRRPSGPVEFVMLAGPSSASMHPRTGRWEWTPDEEAAGQRFPVKLAIRVSGPPARQTVCEFSVIVRENRPSPRNAPVAGQIHEKEPTPTVSDQVLDNGLPPRERLIEELVLMGVDVTPQSAEGRYLIEGDDVVIQEFASPAAAQTAAATMTAASLDRLFSDVSPASRPRLFCRRTLLVMHSGNSEYLIASLQDVLGPPLVVNRSSPMPDKSPSPPFPTPPVSEFSDGFSKLYRAGTLSDPAQYSTLRRLSAARFEREHATELAAAFQGSGADLERWLGQHVELREELYTAFEPTDDVVAALKIIERLHGRSFQRLTADFELAIATAVTWDRESGVYEYLVAQRRSHATASREKNCDAVDNFDYYSDPNFPGRGRTRKLPWEFLMHVVNHRTPLDERQWAQRTYHEYRRPIGQCYDDVAYDYGMIKSGETTSNLAGRTYTLANLKERGGVCAMQADFASRVAKCQGIPAAYVEGFARTGAHHAWVMWTDLQSASTTGLAFSLESHGRFFIDRYYVGQLLEPQSGRMIADRELELRLQGVGLNPQAYRQAKLILRAWSELKSQLQLTVPQQLDVLEAVIGLSPGNQAVWQAVAQLARSEPGLSDLKPRMDGLRDRCLKTFTNCPDFVCQIVDDLLAYEPELSRRLPAYDRLLQLWASTGRPDLTCRLRLQLTNQLVADKQYQAALGGLAQTVKKFPDEGRYIPQLLDKYEAVAKQVDDGSAKVLKLYQELMPLIPRRRQNQTSQFYLEMLNRASRRFEQAGEVKAAKAYADQAKKLQGK